MRNNTQNTLKGIKRQGKEVGFKKGFKMSQ